MGCRWSPSVSSSPMAAPPSRPKKRVSRSPRPTCSTRAQVNSTLSRFRKPLSDLGARLSTHADRDSSLAAIEVLSSKLEQALPLLADAVIRPRHEKKEWTRVSALWMNALKNRAQRARRSCASGHIAPLFMATSTPMVTHRTAPSVPAKKIQLADIVAWHRKIWRPTKQRSSWWATSPQPIHRCSPNRSPIGRPPALPHSPVASPPAALTRWRAHVRRRSFRCSAGHHVVRAFGAPRERPVLSASSRCSTSRSAGRSPRGSTKTCAKTTDGRYGARSPLQRTARRGHVRGARRHPRQRDLAGAG